MTKKHYVVIASIIKDNTIDDDIQITDNECRSYTLECINKDDLIYDLCKVFKQDNNLFDSSRFRRACDDV